MGRRPVPARLSTMAWSRRYSWILKGHLLGAVEMIFIDHGCHCGSIPVFGAAYHTSAAFHYDICGGPQDTGRHGNRELDHRADLHLRIHIEQHAARGNVLSLGSETTLGGSNFNGKLERKPN